MRGLKGDVCASLRAIEGRSRGVGHCRRGPRPHPCAAQGALGTCWFASAVAVVVSSRPTVLRLFRDLPLLHALRLSGGVGGGGGGAGGRGSGDAAQLAAIMGSPAGLREYFARTGAQLQEALLLRQGGGSSSSRGGRRGGSAGAPFTGNVADLASIPLSPLGAYQVRLPETPPPPAAR